MTTPSDRLHKLASELWSKAMSDGDYSYQPHAIRIDVAGWHMLLASKDAFKDASFDRFEHPEKMQWRGLRRIMVHQPVNALMHDIKEAKMDEAIACEMLCIEARQPGENGRRKYYDATPEELEAAMKREGWE